MSENKMVSPPWVVSRHSSQSWIYAVNGLPDGGDVICDQPLLEDSSKHWEGNAEAICKAVNSTYGNGINPEAVKELMDILIEFNGLRNYKIPKHSINLSLLDLFPGRFAKAQEIIEKAKIK